MNPESVGWGELSDAPTPPEQQVVEVVAVCDQVEKAGDWYKVRCDPGTGYPYLSFRSATPVMVGTKYRFQVYQVS